MTTKQERIANFARHFNATPVEFDQHGTLRPVALPQAQDNEIAQEASRLRDQIYQMFAAGVPHVTVACFELRVREAVLDMMDEADWSRVSFYNGR